MKKGTKPPARKPGRPPLDQSGTQTVCRVRLAPAEVEWLVSKFGSVNAGLRALVERCRDQSSGNPR